MDYEVLEFEKYLEDMQQEILIKAKEQMEQALKKNVQQDLYNSYNPTTYKRTNQLKNSILSTLDVIEAKTYFDESKLNYTSAVDGHNVSSYVPRFVNDGHSDAKGSGEYHDYKGRKFMEDTKRELEQIYGKDSFMIGDNA